MAQFDFKKLEKKLESIIDPNYKKNSINFHFEDVIRSIEKECKLKLPIEYKMFLLNFSNCIFKDDIYYQSIEKSPWTPGDGLESVEVFYGLENDDINLRKRIQQYSGRIPDGLIPIAESPGGNQICIGVKGKYTERIYFWDHENISTKGGSNLYLIANLFSDFIMSFELHHRDLEVNLDDIEVLLDDDLLND